MAVIRGTAKPRIEKSRIVYAKLTHYRIDRHHLSRVIRRNVQFFFRGQDIKLSGN